MSEHSGNSVDDIDRRLIALLNEDARMSIRGLARQIGMSPGAVGERLERLTSSGVIRGFRVDTDRAALGYGLEVLIGLQLRQGKPVGETIDALLSIDAVEKVALITGQWDLMVTMHVKDQHHLKDILLGRVWAIADFSHSQTMLILQTFPRTPSMED